MRRKGMNALTVSVAILIMTLVAVTFTGCEGSPLSEEVDAVSLGEWVETKQESERDGKLYPMKYRITGVDREKSSVDKRIDEYNASAMGSTIKPLENGNLEYAIADYDAYYPEDFPDDEFGITAVAVTFTIAGVDGKPEIAVDGTNYKGLTETWEIGAPPMGYDFYSDSTYKGSFLFVMVKDNKDYVFEEKYSEDGKDIIHYTRGI